MEQIGVKRGFKTANKDYQSETKTNIKRGKKDIDRKSVSKSKSKNKDITENVIPINKMSLSDDEDIDREFEDEEDPEFYGRFYNDYSSDEHESVDLGYRKDINYDKSSDEEDNNINEKTIKKKVKKTTSEVEKDDSFNGEVEALDVTKIDNSFEEDTKNKEFIFELPCRQTEQKRIEDYILNGLKVTGAYSSLYISGMPGTGKTASVLASLKKLKEMTKKKSIEDFDCLIINGMKITNNNNVYKQIHKHIFNENIKGNTSSKCCNMLDLFFKNRSSYNFKPELNKPKNPHLILIIDEIDCLVSKKMNLLYNIFNWTTYADSKLIIISISNTIDLPQKTLSKVSSRMGSNQLAFRPYTKKELEEILEKCLPHYNLFTKDAISFCSSKVASISGDIRRILNICKTAISNLMKKYKKGTNALKKQSGLINIEDIRVASSELYDNKINKVIKGLKLYEKLAILGISISMSDYSRVEIPKAYEKFCFCCLKIKINIFPNFNDFKLVLFNLLKLKLVSFTEFNENFIDNHVYIQVYRDELISAFNLEENLKPIIEFINNK